jgi:hypothetical protein
VRYLTPARHGIPGRTVYRGLVGENFARFVIYFTDVCAERAMLASLNARGRDMARFEPSSTRRAGWRRSLLPLAAMEEVA